MNTEVGVPFEVNSVLDTPPILRHRRYKKAGFFMIKEKIKNNIWETNIDETIQTIKELTKPDTEWIWTYNWNCKYICLRFDMRDGAFIILNNKGERISLEQLKHQNL